MAAAPTVQPLAAQVPAPVAAWSLVESLLFFHPAVWWLSSQMRDAREEIADAVAAQALVDPRRMAPALNALSLQQADRSSPRLAVAASGGKLLPRLERLLASPAQAGRWKLALPGVALACGSLWVQANTNSAGNSAGNSPIVSTSAAKPELARTLIPTADQLLQLPLDARHALILDDSSGAVVMAKDADTAMPIASITRLMTAMVVLDARPDLQERLRIAAADRSPRVGGAAPRRAARRRRADESAQRA